MLAAREGNWPWTVSSQDGVSPRINSHCKPRGAKERKQLCHSRSSSSDSEPLHVDVMGSEQASGQTVRAEGGGKQEVESTGTGRASKMDEIMACQWPKPLIILQVQQEVQSSERTSEITEVKESWRRACQWLKPIIFQVIYGNDIDTIAGQLKQRKKNWPNYTLKTLLFSCTMLFSAYMNLSSSTSVAIKILFVVDIVVFFIIDGVLYINLPRWGNALVCISCLLLQVALCLLTVPFNGCYAFAILVVLFLIVVVALLQPKFQHSVNKYVLPSFTTDDGDTQEGVIDQENQYLNHLFDVSDGIATCGGLVTGIMGYYSYMEGPVTAAGFFFFSTVLLGLYLMMIIAMRAVSAPHAVCLVIVLKVLLLLTIITASNSFVHHSVTNPKVVK